MTVDTPILELRNAAFGYGGDPVVAGIDLAIRAGQLVGVLGPNGAGKTTLVRGLAGLLKPLSGAMLCRAERVGFVPQRETLDSLFPLSVEEVVQMGGYGRLGGWHSLSRDERSLTLDCLERVGLGAFRRSAFVSLSGGQRQRVLLARALMTRPDLCLFDEPIRGVDRAAEANLLRVVRELAADGTAVLWIDHGMVRVRRLCEVVLWVADGRVQVVPGGTLHDTAALARLQQPSAKRAT